MDSNYKYAIIVFVMGISFLVGCTSQTDATIPATPEETLMQISAADEVEFTLKTIAEGGKMLYLGVGGDIDGIINPDLIVPSGGVARIILINGDGMVHDLFLPDFDVETGYIRRIGDQAEITVDTGEMPSGSYVYYCTLPGHRRAGQEGNLIVAEQ